MPMLTSINDKICNRSLVPLASREANNIYDALDVIMRSYNHAGMMVQTIHSNRKFKAIMNDVKDNMDVDMEHPAAGDHVPQAERNNQTIGERVRAGYF